MVKTYEVDRISELSNALLAHVLSCLQTKEVVKTGILSRRWKSLWTKVPILDFSGLYLRPSHQPSFKAFLYKALVLNEAPVIYLFRLDRVNEIEDFHLNSLIWSLMQRDVSEITLNSSLLKEQRLMETLFSSEKLRELKLNGKFILPNLVPSVQHLPNLVLLQLTDVAFEKKNTLQALLSVCSRLIELLLDDCFGLNVVRIQSSSLRKLTIINNRDTMKTVVLEAPNLEYIYITDDVLGYDIEVVGPVAHLVEARFDFPWKKCRCGIIDLLCQTSTLQTLRMTYLTASDSLKNFSGQFPVLHCLIYLELAYCAGPIVLQILEHSPNLRSLVLHHTNYMDDTEESMDYWSWYPLPEDAAKCFSRTLKMVEINNFHGVS